MKQIHFSHALQNIYHYGFTLKTISRCKKLGYIAPSLWEH